MSLKHTPRTRILWTYGIILDIYKQNTNNKLIYEEIQSNAKHETIFKTIQRRKYIFFTRIKRSNNTGGSEHSGSKISATAPAPDEKTEKNARD